MWWLLPKKYRSPRATRLAWRLFWSHTVLASILLIAVGITLSGLIGMNAMIAEVKNGHLTDFEDEEQVHRAAWAIETEARHGALACAIVANDDDAADVRAQATARMQRAKQELASLLQQYDGRVVSAVTRVAAGYLQFGAQIVEGDVCAHLRDPNLDRHRLALDEEMTNAWIGKLRELRLAILQNEVAAQRIGAWSAVTGIGLGVAALIAAGLIARSVARGVTVPLSLLAGHARRLGEGDFSELPPATDGPYEVAQLTHELERMRARLAEVNQLKLAFLSSVSHDLRTPLGHIREALCLLLDGTVGQLESKQQRVAELALRACEREIRLVSALLDLARVRSGRPVMMRENQDIDEVIDNALEHVSEDAARAAVEVDVVATDMVPPLTLDTTLVETALVNLLTNAFAASAPGAKVRVDRRVVAEAPEAARGPGPWLQILVEDTGGGVPDELKEKIFEPFFTRRSGPHGGGSGLGLPLAREMVRGHGGELSLVNSSRAGATFAIWLPVEHV